MKKMLFRYTGGLPDSNHFTPGNTYEFVIKKSSFTPYFAKCNIDLEAGNKCKATHPLPPHQMKYFQRTLNVSKNSIVI